MTHAKPAEILFGTYRRQVLALLLWSGNRKSM
jgi:hypothetical protein